MHSVNTPKLFQHRTNGNANCLAIRHIDMERKTVTARIRCGLPSRVQITIENGDRGSFPRVCKSALPADAIATTRQ